MTLSAKSSTLHPGSQLLPILIWLLVPSTSTSISLALHFSLHSPTSHLPSPLLFLLLLLGSPSEIHEFSLPESSFSPIGGCLIIINFYVSLFDSFGCTLADRLPSLLPFPIDGSGQPLFSPESTSSHTGQVPIDEDSEEAILAGQNTGSPVINGNGILHTPVSPRLPYSSSFSRFRRSDPPPSVTSSRFDDGIPPTPHFSTRLPSPSSLRRSGSSLLRSSPPQQASSTPVSRSSPSTLGAHPLTFSPLPSPQFSPSSPHPSPVLACLPIPLPPVPSLSALLVSLHSLLLRLPSRQVAQCSLPCPFLVDIACHYVSLCRSLISLPSPSLQFPSATGGVNLRSRSFHYNRISKILVCTSFLYIHLSFCPYGSDPSTVQKSL